MSATAIVPEAKSAPSGFTVVSASAVTDSSANPVNNATIYFQPVALPFGQWISYAVNRNGQSLWEAVSTQVVNGAFSIVLADTSLTTPANIAYQVRIIDNTSGADLLGPNYFIQPTGATWDFDTYVPGADNMIPTTQGILYTDAFTSGFQQTQFILSRLPLMGMLVGLYVNGIWQAPGKDYTLVGNLVTTSWSTTLGDRVNAVYFAN